jgi:glutamyl-tRNA reductase
LVEADVVVTSTSAPGFVIGRDVVASLRRKRRGRSLFFIDLAVPRDVEPQVEDIDSVFLYNIDDFSKLVADSQKSRAREAERAAELIAEETLGWERWAEAEQAKPTIVALRQRLGGVLTRELERSLRGRLKHLSAEDRAALQAMLDAALNKMLHPATRRLREIASDREYEQIRLEQFAMTLNEVFALETADTPLDDEELVSAPRPLEAPPKEDAQDGADEPRAELPASARRALGSGG